MADLTENITTEKQLRKIVREEVTAALEQFADDPDAELPMSHEFKKS